jgi:hypothetical protein
VCLGCKIGANLEVRCLAATPSAGCRNAVPGPVSIGPWGRIGGRILTKAKSMNSDFRMPFGKHKGTPVKDLPGDYLKWLSTIELRDPLASEVKKAMSWRPVSLQKPMGIGNTAASARSTFVGAATPPPARSEGVLSGSQRPERTKPKLPWIPRPEQEDLSAYYSANSNDGIGF